MKDRFKHFFDPYYYNCFTYTPEMRTVADLNSNKNASDQKTAEDQETSSTPPGGDTLQEKPPNHPPKATHKDSNPKKRDTNDEDHNANIFEDEFLPLSEGHPSVNNIYSNRNQVYRFIKCIKSENN